jgi:hypothetical protein
MRKEQMLYPAPIVAGEHLVRLARKDGIGAGIRVFSPRCGFRVRRPETGVKFAE